MALKPVRQQSQAKPEKQRAGLHPAREAVPASPRSAGQAAPSLLTPAAVLQLQNTVGNRRVTRQLQNTIQRALMTQEEMGEGGIPRFRHSGNYAEVYWRIKGYHELEGVQTPQAKQKRTILLAEMQHFITAWFKDTKERGKNKPYDKQRSTILNSLISQSTEEINQQASGARAGATEEMPVPQFWLAFTNKGRYNFFYHLIADQQKEALTDPKIEFDPVNLKVSFHYGRALVHEIYPKLAAALQGYGDEQIENPLDVEQMKTEREAVLAQAHKELLNFDFGPYDAAFGDAELQTLAQGLGKDQTEPISFLYEHQQKNQQGIILSERHEDPIHRQFLIKNMGTLREQGVETIYIEQIRKDDRQYLVDEYFEKKDSEMSPQLKAFADLYKITQLLETAKNCDMRVVGIDSLSTSKDQGAVRALTMNLVAHDIIMKDKAQGHTGKYIILVGAAHAHTHAKDPTQGVDQAVPGLAQLLSIPAVKVTIEGVNLFQEDKRKRTG